MALEHVNAVVIGSGAGGGIVAKELAAAGMKVALLERGRWISPYECAKDDLRNQRTSVLGASFGPDDEERNPRVKVEKDGSEQIVYPSRGAYNNNAMCVGGGTASYGAMAWRFMPQDFRLKTTYGAVEGSTLEDWPITYDDLEPFYEQAEYEIGVSGDVVPDPFKGPRRKPLPMPPLPPNREYAVLRPAALRLGLHPFDIPMLRNSVPYGGRQACMRCRWCVGFACEVNAKCGTQNTVIPAALASGNCELRTEAIVKEIVLDAGGKARGVKYIDEKERLREQTADVVIVSCGAIESARLLLNSKSRLFPNGIGNNHDWVGRNLQGHAYTGANGLMPFDCYDDVGPGAGVAICDYNHGNKGLVGGGMLCNEFIRLPYQFLGRMPPWIPAWGKEHKDFVRTWYRRAVNVQGPVQEMPVFHARVEADPKVKDYWGVPVARMSGNKHPHTLEIADFMSRRAEEWLKEAGATRTWRRVPGDDLSAGQHQAGTCRMGNDPKTSVVDKHCRVHDVDNLYVVDASVHVTNGGFNPVLTIMAIAYWASHHLLKARS
ncbi:MAG: GMC family oxidoreductase [Bryobacteraceae bacterium]|nr:GMC family oxidoreductase [Bryobacteraceae bacterium]